MGAVGRWALIAALLAFAVGSAGAQEFSGLLGGKTAVIETRETSYAWSFEYRQAFASRFDWTLTYLNEGHPTGHHRDGIAAQAWYRYPFFGRRLWLGVGGGIYRYYDTEIQPDGTSANVHHIPGIFSFQGTYYTKSPWFARMVVNRVVTRHGLNTVTYTAGVGYRLWTNRFDKERAEPGRQVAGNGKPVTHYEATAFIGSTTVNTFLSQKARARGLEIRRGMGRNIDWTVTWLNEGNNELIRRNGLASQAWYVRAFLEERLALGIGGGVYFNLDRRQVSETDPSEGRRSLAGLATMSVSWRLGRRWTTRINWNRIVTTYSRDTDVFTFGVGRRWG